MKLKIKPIYFSISVFLVALFFSYEAVSSQHLSYHFSFVGYGGTFKYHDLKIFGIPIYWFMLICGFIITFFVSWNRRKEYQLSNTASIICPILFIVTAYIGAKLLFVLENYEAYRNQGLELDGVSLFGAIFIILLTIPLYSLLAGKSILAMYDYFTPLGIILLSCVRIGCFFNGCCGAYTVWNETTPIILPVQLMEVVCDLVILEVCLAIEKKYPYKGYMYPVFMFLYGICRFLLEFLRETPKDTFNLSHGQIFSLIAVALSIVLLAITKNVKTKLVQ